MPTWERLEQAGCWPALFLTIKEVLFEPSKTFARMPREPLLGRPLLFNVIVATIGALATAFYELIMWRYVPSSSSYRRLFEIVNIAPEQISFPVLALCALFAAAIVVFLTAIWAFIRAGIFHITLMMFGGANESYETTFRTLCYTAGAADIFGIVPFCGWIIGGIWGVVCAAI
ncbi:YIP1 family protein, partial [Candidatus Sumerlaeota bacterium]|nr:YIP1 family protein [Candidatus Sumerlaeota bacterium]